MRAIDEEDFTACEAIYRLNEPTQFPPGYFDHFADWLRRRDSLVVALKRDGRVLAFGGISSYETKYSSGPIAAVLAFGMVHPDCQRQGLGTVLLLSRLSALARPAPVCPVVLSAAGGSDTFYQRFGFRSVGRFPAHDGSLFDTYRMRLYGKDWEICRATLQEAGVELDLADAVVPSMPISDIDRAPPRMRGARQ